MNIICKDSYIDVDFSTFCGFQTLSFGVQTNAGRAIPIWADCITYPIQQATSQNIFIIDQIKQFKAILGYYPRFVFDRGFMIPSLIKFMIENDIVFYIRMKKAKHVVWKDTHIPIHKLKGVDSTIQAYGATLKVIRSDKPDDEKEPWYIISNDMQKKREKIVRIYYYRFEIEEVFKDMKHLFDVKKLLIRRKQTFRILLWFMILSFWIAYKTGVLTNYLSQRITVHPKKRISWIKLWFEQMRREVSAHVYSRMIMLADS
jgi:hypothetical protein